jgi:hypothetical protein
MGDLGQSPVHASEYDNTTLTDDTGKEDDSHSDTSGRR